MLPRSSYVGVIAVAAALLPLKVLAVDQVDSVSAHLKNTAVPVNVNNYVMAETAGQFDRILKLTGGVNKLESFREPTPLDKQAVIRMNRDTLYSFAIVDISKGATLTMPETNGRYNSAMIVNENEYINKVFYEPGTHSLTKEEFATGYVLVAFRTSDRLQRSGGCEKSERASGQVSYRSSLVHSLHSPEL